MNVKKGILTPNEEMVMNWFWENDRPLSSRDIMAWNEKGWGVEQVSNILRALERKEMIQFCGKVSGKTRPDGKTQPVRQFTPLMSKEQYLLKSLDQKGMNLGLLHKMTAALAEKVGSRAVIEELEKIIKEVEQKNE